MKVSEALKKRRAIKEYDPDFVISEKDVKRLFEHALLSPSSFNLQHWRFAAVTDREIKEQLCEAAWGQRHIRQASLDVVAAADPDAAEDASRYWRDAPEAVRERMIPKIENFYKDRRLKRDEAIRSTSLAAMSLMLVATEMGYETCPMIGFDPMEVARIVGMPESWIPVMIITVGRGTEEPDRKPGRLPIEEVVFWNRFDGEPLK